MPGMFRNLGRALRLMRELRGMSQVATSTAAGIGKSQLSKYETGKELPKPESLEKVLTALGLTYMDFFLTLQSIDSRERALDGEDPPPTLHGSFVPTGLLPDAVTAGFIQLAVDVFDLHRRVLTEVACPHDPARGTRRSRRG